MAKAPRADYASADYDLEIPEVSPEPAPKPASNPVQAKASEPDTKSDASTARDDGALVIPSYDGTKRPKVAPVSRRISATTARERIKAARSKPKPGPDEYIQRSIYARPDTFERIKRLAAEEDQPIAEMYREALLLLLRKYRRADGIASIDLV